MHLKRLKFLVVALVALLQCALPLIHAHAHETPGTHHVHIHGDELGAAVPAPAATPEIKVPATASPAIGVSQEFKRDTSLLPVIGFLVAVFLAAAFIGRTVLFPRKQRAALAAPLHSRPPATAPPARAA